MAKNIKGEVMAKDMFQEGQALIIDNERLHHPALFLRFQWIHKGFP
jgi:hypothetical protein